MTAKGSIALFIERVRDNCDSDYGDFMRQMNLYITNLKDQLANETFAIRGKLDEMQTYTQFAANWKVESTRSRLLDDAGTLVKWLDHEKYPEVVHTPLVERGIGLLSERIARLKQKYARLGRDR